MLVPAGILQQCAAIPHASGAARGKLIIEEMRPT
jgi:hypothetical protein